MGYPQRNPVKICLRRQNKGKSVERGGIGADLLSGTETMQEIIEFWDKTPANGKL